MTTMTIVDVCKYIYPGEVENRNIMFGQESGQIFISFWNVSGHPQPAVQELQNLIPSYQAQFDFDYFIQVGAPLLSQFIDEVAYQRQYDSAISCVSYINSSIAQWKLEAEAFNQWRDNVINYSINQFALMQSGQRTIPTFEQFKQELPTITWP